MVPCMARQRGDDKLVYPSHFPAPDGHIQAGSGLGGDLGDALRFQLHCWRCCDSSCSLCLSRIEHNSDSSKVPNCGSPEEARIVSSLSRIRLGLRGRGGCERKSRPTVSIWPRTDFSTWTSFSRERCSRETDLNRRQQMEKMEAERASDEMTVVTKPRAASSKPETRFIPKKPETAADAPMASPAIDRISSSRAIRLRSLSRVSSRTPCVVSILVASCSTRSLSASSLARYTSSSVSTTSSSLSCSASSARCSSRDSSSLASASSRSRARRSDSARSASRPAISMRSA
mmetsp:Transcript_31001/g.84735  ORF Transcript_31001/g.84735 Transcript_31001/m.84735 type:complete len:288 (-) Transcript_31001:1086-1949(-)